MRGSARVADDRIKIDDRIEHVAGADPCVDRLPFHFSGCVPVGGSFKGQDGASIDLCSLLMYAQDELLVSSDDIVRAYVG